MKQFIDKIGAQQNLTFSESKEAFKILMEGKANDQEIFDFLTLLSNKGESSDEIAGGVYVLREKSKRVNVEDCIDTCGTGGDGMNTLNISTASALLLASMGVKVAKHGNKAVSSKCGSGDVLEALNIKINLEPNEIETQINKNNFGFMFAPNYHSAMRFVGPTRKKIGKRTIFNMIGPLSSPALVKRQVVGVFDKKLLRIFANALNNLNIKFAWIVNSEDGLDEISPYAKTNVIQLKDNKILLYAGTKYHLSQWYYQNKLDYLFVDEASQISVADLIALGGIAKNIVLVGDQQQLGHILHSL